MASFWDFSKATIAELKLGWTGLGDLRWQVDKKRERASNLNDFN